MVLRSKMFGKHLFRIQLFDLRLLVILVNWFVILKQEVCTESLSFGFRKRRCIS